MADTAQIQAQLIDLNDYVRSGEGANGASYNHKNDPDTMLKLYFSNIDMDLVRTELDIAGKVFKAGIPSPEPGSFVTDGKGNYGIKFRRLVGKISYASAIGKEPQKVEHYAREFAKMCLQLHSTDVSGSGLPTAKEQYLGMLRENNFWTEAQKAFIKNIIESTPDTNTALHGDLQYGNLLLVGDKSYFIDLGEAAMGHPYFDLGMTIICGVYNEEDFTQEFFHMSSKTAAEFWKFFVDEYFHGQYTLEQADELLFPYAVVKCLLIERNMKAPLERFHKFFLERYGIQ